MAAIFKFGKLDRSRTHDESRQLVCCVCSRKVNQANKRSGVTKILSEKMSDLVRKFVYDKYSVHNPLHPTALCGSCRLVLAAMEKVKIKFIAVCPLSSASRLFWERSPERVQIYCQSPEF